MGEVLLARHWRLGLAFDTSLPGLPRARALRHVEGRHELTEEKTESLGQLVQASSAALVEVTGV